MKKISTGFFRFIIFFVCINTAILTIVFLWAPSVSGIDFWTNEQTEEQKISLEDISPYLKDALVAVEDRRFFKHKGFDYARIINAFKTNLKAGKVIEGGSTISQQYIKNAYLSPERTWSRKIKEAYLTIKLERNNSKEDILSMYLDTIYFGSGAFGIENASRMYFGIEPSELDLAQAALLAGLIRSPENYSPFKNLELSITRRNLVLTLMLEQNYISKQQYIDAVSSPVGLNN